MSIALRVAAALLAVGTLLAFTLACAKPGVRSVWVHPDWYEGKFEEDFFDCSGHPAWKICMVTKGWDTEVGWRSSPLSRPAS